MYKAIVIRLFPTKSQAKLFWQNVGTARWTWNWGLNFQKNLYAESQKILSIYELKRKFTEVRNSEEFKWLQEVSRQVEANALIDLDKAYKNFFRRLKAGKIGGMPKFKSKGKCTPSLESKIILRDVKMGIDVGVKSLAVVSCGRRKRVFKNINRSYKMRRLTRQLKHHQRILSGKKKGSKNYMNEKYKVQDLYGRIKRRRHEYIQQTARKIVNMRPKVIVLEDLNIQGMMKNHHLAGAVAEQNLYLLRMLIERKAADLGIEIKIADRFYPSSKTCSNCGHVKKDLKLSERIYKCPECGKIIDRDFNAALNLERLAE